MLAVPVLKNRLSKIDFKGKLTVLLVLLALIFGILTYATLTGAPPLGPDPQTIQVLLLINSILLLLLGSVVFKQMFSVWRQRRRGMAGASIQARMVFMFGVVAAVPAVLVAVFATLFFSAGIEEWFSSRVRTAVTESNAIARAYLEEHKKVIEGDALSMAQDINRQSFALSMDPDLLADMVRSQMLYRSLTDVVIVDANGTQVASARQVWAAGKITLPHWALEEAKNLDKVVLLTSDQDDRVRALVKLSGFTDKFLYVGRRIDPKVIERIERTEEAAGAYEDLEGQRSILQYMFTLVYVMVALLLTLVAVWVGMRLSARLVKPIATLIGASYRVSSGDLDVRVPEGEKGEEINELARAFNRMTQQLSEQRNKLVEANQQIDTRRIFTETVLSEVSTGVIGLDHKGCITLPNLRASELLSADLEANLGASLIAIVPEMEAFMVQMFAEASQKNGVYQTVHFKRGDQRHKLVVHLSRLTQQTSEAGYVLTLDDVTTLEAAQRNAAWSEVARRLAHEIKNPLTPIQLSAERLRRKYTDQITKDPEVFSSCIDMIVRQVGDIGRMVDEFSSFARMPKPIIKEANFVSICEEAIFLVKSGFSEVAAEQKTPDSPVMFKCDERQLLQALQNILKNSAESLLSKQKESKSSFKPKMILTLNVSSSGLQVLIEDNGDGFPEEKLLELTDPYVTHKIGGTGLGLAIVRKIIEDHGGVLTLSNRSTGGACVEIKLPNVRI